MSPLLVQFVHPSDWIVLLLPSQKKRIRNTGPIHAGQFAKGDTAIFFDDSEGLVAKTSDQPERNLPKKN